MPHPAHSSIITPRVFKVDHISPLEGWWILLLLFGSEFLAYLIFGFVKIRAFPTFPEALFDLEIKVLAYVAITLYCVRRYGALRLTELVPTRKDFLMVGIALFITLWIFGLLIGPERLGNLRHEGLKHLSSLHYGLGLFVVVGLAPLFEEIIFRRYFLEIQRENFSTGTALLITTIAATLLHIDSLENLTFTVFGHFVWQGLFGLLYLNGRLITCVLTHSFFNGLVMLLSL